MKKSAERWKRRCEGLKVDALINIGILGRRSSVGTTLKYIKLHKYFPAIENSKQLYNIQALDNRELYTMRYAYLIT